MIYDNNKIDTKFLHEEKINIVLQSMGLFYLYDCDTGSCLLLQKNSNQ